MLELSPPRNDGRTNPLVGPWSREKHWFLRRYVDAFTAAMNKKNWSGLHYIDLFAGAGIEMIEGTSELDWGSPLIAAQAAPPFTRLHLCELDRAKFDALSQRLVNFRAPGDQLVCGDANEKVAEIVKAIPPKSLSLAFLDPFGLHLDYEMTLSPLSSIRADLIIFFPDRLDAARNWEAYYFENPNSNLDRVLGRNCNWREAATGIATRNYGELFRRLYVEQIKKLGYLHFEFEGVPSYANRLYWLIYCTRAKAGIEIWRNVAEKKPDGQRTMRFD